MDKFGLLYETIQTEPFELQNAGLSDKLAGIKYDLDISNDVENDDLIDDLVDDDESIYDDELDKDMVYAAEMVTILEIPSKGKMYACVEAGDLVKFMKMNDIEIGDIQDAIAKIATANNVDINNIAVVIESNSYLKSLITEAKKAKGGPALSILDNVSKLAKNLKDKGFKVLKKKSKK